MFLHAGNLFKSYTEMHLYPNTNPTQKILNLGLKPNPDSHITDAHYTFIQHALSGVDFRKESRNFPVISPELGLQHDDSTV